MTPLGRRRLIRLAAAGLVAAPAISRAQARPVLSSGLQFGDPVDDRALVWAMADRPARLMVEWDTTDSFANARPVAGPWLGPDSALTGQIDLTGLPPGETIVVRAWAEDDGSLRGEPVTGQVRTAPALGRARDVRIAWSGDQVGQGYGISPERGGLSIFSAIADADPDLFIHSGDQIYADSPLAAERRLNDGTIWRNLVTPAKSKVAETLDEYRGNYIYNFLDEHVRRFHARVPKLAQWDDHDVRNNWYPGRLIEDVRYGEKRADVLAARGRRAFFEMNPIRATAAERIYRSIPYGELAEVFLLDGRSHRGPNPAALAREPGPEAAYFGSAQLAWLKAALARSRAVWKIIACDQPLALMAADGPAAVDAISNGVAALGGREFEIAELLAFIKHERIANTAWVSAEVHHAAAYRYDPAGASAGAGDFDPFWEFVAGPLHAACITKGFLDPTFGPDERFLRCPAPDAPFTPPDGRFTSFGTLTIDSASHVLTARLHGGRGEELYAVDIEPRRVVAGRP